MRSRIDVRIRPNGNSCPVAGISGNSMNRFQLSRRLDIEKQNTGIESVPDFAVSFADPGKNDFFRITPSPKYPEQFTAGNDVESDTPFRKTAEQIDVGIRLYCVADQVRNGTKSLIKHLNVSS